MLSMRARSRDGDHGGALGEHPREHEAMRRYAATRGLGGESPRCRESPGAARATERRVR